MKEDQDKIRDQLIDQLAQMYRQIYELDMSETKSKQAVEAPHEC